MKREAWEAMNNVVSRSRPNLNAQAISDQIVEALHDAGFIIVPHSYTPAKTFEEHIRDRQKSEQ